MKFLYKVIVFVVCLAVIFGSLYAYVEVLNAKPTYTMGVSVHFTKENYSDCDNVTFYLNVTCWKGFSEFKDHTYPEDVYVYITYLGNKTQDLDKYIYKTEKQTSIVQGNPYLNCSAVKGNFLPQVELPFNLSNKHPDDRIVWNYTQTNSTQGFYAYCVADVMGPGLTINGHRPEARASFNPRSPFELNYPYIYV